MSMENIAGARKPAKREDEHTVAGEHRMMRRADREVTDPERIAAIIAACDIVEVAYADAEGLTIVPLNFGFDYEYDEATGKLTLWFHSAPRGRKLDAIRAAAGGRLPVAFHHADRLRGGGGPHHVQLGPRRSSRSSAMARRHWSRIWMNAATACRR
mgnify:CR=1 FL=1